MTTPTVQTNYAASATLANDLSSLASSSSFIAGHSSAIIDNTADKHFTKIVAGCITVGTSPTAGTQIQIWVVPAREDGGGTYVWPNAFNTSPGDSPKTVTNAGGLSAYAYPAKPIQVDSTTSDRPYDYVVDIRAACGYMPAKCVLFTTHNTVSALNATSANHVTKVTGIYETVPSI